jgi:hypothetical protein
MQKGTSACLPDILHTLSKLAQTMMSQHFAQFGPELIQQACQLMDRLATNLLLR